MDNQSIKYVVLMLKDGRFNVRESIFAKKDFEKYKGFNVNRGAGALLNDYTWIGEAKSKEDAVAICNEERLKYLQ